jgi:hypothetical protein
VAAIDAVIEHEEVGQALLMATSPIRHQDDGLLHPCVPGLDRHLLALVIMDRRGSSLAPMSPVKESRSAFTRA